MSTTHLCDADGAAYAARSEELVSAGWLQQSGLDGVVGRTGLFESVVDGLVAAVSAAGADQAAEVRRYPPVVPTSTFVSSGYLRSFPDLLGAVSTFAGDDRDHRRLLDDIEGGRSWDHHLQASGTVLCAAACHPLYPTLPPVLPAPDARFDVYGWVFRHEPSPDPARLQAFRQYEFVYVGTPGGAQAHRDLWRDRAAALLGGLGLDVEVAVANDPFFGRAGRLLAASQQEAALKFEVLAATSAASRRTAIASANCHEDHFGTAFGIRTPDGEPAHTACVGFGVERIVLALTHAHGTDVRTWPAPVREGLGL